MAPYCAPTALAALLDCTNLEAATLLLKAGVASDKVGAVKSRAWHGWLREALDGVEVSTKHPDAKERVDAALKRWEASSAWRRSNPRTDVAYYTLKQFLRAYPSGTYVVSINGHTLLVSDGKVQADTYWRSKMRARVYRATGFTS